MYRRNGRGRLLLLVFIALSIIVITLDFRQGEGGPLVRAKEISVAVVAPIQRGLTTVFRPVGNFFASIGELGSLRTDNAELKDRLELMEQEVKEAEAFQSEFAALTRLMELDAPWTSGDFVNAQVIGSSRWKGDQRDARQRIGPAADRSESRGRSPDREPPRHGQDPGQWRGPGSFPRADRFELGSVRSR